MCRQNEYKKDLRVELLNARIGNSPSVSSETLTHSVTQTRYGECERIVEKLKVAP